VDHREVLLNAGILKRRKSIVGDFHAEVSASTGIH
jgi:hypothetical protein